MGITVVQNVSNLIKTANAVHSRFFTEFKYGFDTAGSITSLMERVFYF